MYVLWEARVTSVQSKRRATCTKKRKLSWRGMGGGHMHFQLGPFVNEMVCVSILPPSIQPYGEGLRNDDRTRKTAAETTTSPKPNGHGWILTEILTCPTNVHVKSSRPRRVIVPPPHLEGIEAKELNMPSDQNCRHARIPIPKRRAMGPLDCRHSSPPHHRLNCAAVGKVGERRTTCWPSRRGNVLLTRYGIIMYDIYTCIIRLGVCDSMRVSFLPKRGFWRVYATTLSRKIIYIRVRVYTRSRDYTVS